MIPAAPWQHAGMPKLVAPTLADNRELRRDALVAAAAEVIRAEGLPSATMAKIAEQAGLSRSAVYEYYRSAADLIADVLVDELHAWVDTLESATAAVPDPRARLETWIRTALAYVADGRHELARAAGEATLPPVRRAQVRSLHQALAEPLVDTLRELDVTAPERTAALIWGVVQATTGAIERGGCASSEIDAAVAFALAGAGLPR